MRFFRFSCVTSVTLLLAGSILPFRVLRPMNGPSEQLNLFHWWNAYPDNETFGPSAARLPVHEGGFVWGRSGHQWIRSIVAYLSWREGSPWRPETHRYHPVRWHFVDCVRIVTTAYYGNVKWWAPSAAHLTIARCPSCLRKRPRSASLPNRKGAAA